MTDTDAQIEARVRELFMRRSGSDRVRMACEMFDLARTLMTANIRAEHPEISEGDRARIVERTYGDDFPAAERDRIMARRRR